MDTTNLVDTIENIFEKLKSLSQKKILEYKMACEANIVSILYKKPELFNECDLTITDFDINCWRVYFETGRRIIKEGKKTLDDVTFGLYLEKHSKLQAAINEYGGYTMITDAGKYVKEENFDGYVTEMRKWQAVLKLNQLGFPIYDKLSFFADMSIDEVYDHYEALVNETFMHASNNYSSHDITDGLYDLIEKLDEGLAVGIPYKNMPILSEETNGLTMGSVSLIGGLSNVGKTAFLRNTIIHSIYEYDERMVIMINEDGFTDWQREMLVYVATNILEKPLKKKDVSKGNFEQQIKETLNEAAKWIIEHMNNHMLTLITFKSYKTDEVLKAIRKYSAMGVKYFAIDTFKMDADQVNDQSWLSMQQNMVRIHDLVKEENKNVHITITFQLAKASTRQRYYMQDNIGMAKSIIDPASCCLMLRKMFRDEYSGGKKELEVINPTTKERVFIDPNKSYQILFIIKNRKGSAGIFQIVLEHNLSTNSIQEVGITNVPLDF